MDIGDSDLPEWLFAVVNIYPRNSNSVTSSVRTYYHHIYQIVWTEFNIFRP